jgi:hypothetical protein
MEMQMPSSRVPKYTCSPSEATSTDLCPPTPCQTPPPNESSSQNVIEHLAQQFLEILKSLITKQGPPPPPAAAAIVKSKELPARASKLEFKTVNKVFVFHVFNAA